jgi:hypothetical protein
VKRLLLLTLIACGAPTVEERRRAAEIPSAHEEPSSLCLLYGYSQGAPEATDAAALENLKLEAVRRDANFVVPEGFTRSNGRVSAGGRIYRCPDSAFRAKPAAACVPDCSPGYVCIDRKCISACNPPCERGQRCGADRICVGTGTAPN